MEKQVYIVVNVDGRLLMICDICKKTGGKGNVPKKYDYWVCGECEVVL